MPNVSHIYRGRFAPSPTGRLHFGSLVAAVGSYLDARAHQGQWRVRMEDLDPPREEAGAADAILRSMEAFGFEWDGPVLYQSTRLDAYAQALAQLRNDGWVFDCGCTRRDIRAIAETGVEGPVYPGTCHDGLPLGTQPRTVRARTKSMYVSFEDRLRGRIIEQVDVDYGDFIIKRADGLFAYQLAVVVDDAFQGITDVVRGNDLLSSTSRQICLQKYLGVPTPRYLHLPIAVGDDGAKLSKQSFARPIDDNAPVHFLINAMRFLGHEPPKEISLSNIADFWTWALEAWNVVHIPTSPTICFNEVL